MIALALLHHRTFQYHNFIFHHQLDVMTRDNYHCCFHLAMNSHVKGISTYEDASYHDNEVVDEILVVVNEVKLIVFGQVVLYFLD